MHISPVHTTLSEVVRVFDPSIINEICNHPEVRPFLGGIIADPIDTTPIVGDSRNYAILHAGFAAVFVAIQPGVFEVHTQALPEARAAGTVALSAASALHWMFTRTNCIEVLTRVDETNPSALALTIKSGFIKDFHVTNGWNNDGNIVPTDVYSLSLQRWHLTAPGLCARGRWFHREIEAACARAGVERKSHPEDNWHDRYAGGACDMILGGSIGKAVLSYNRWAAISGYAPIAPISLDPIIIHIGDMAVRVTSESLEVVKCQ